VNSSVRVTLGVALVAVGALAGIAMHRMLRPRATLVPAVAAAQAPQPQDAPPSRVIPMALPDLALADLSGVTQRLTDFRGHPVIINFWATWCEPCRREIPLLIRLRHERSGAGLAVVGIAVDFRDAVATYARKAGIDYPILIGEDSGLDTVHAFGMDLVFPFSVFADQGGRIVAVKVGELHQDEADFILDRVQDIDSGALSLAAAQEKIGARLKEFAVERAKHA
jgi:thiol-disulfide isomerase/thioredoxin